jgi:hypothetical protein
MAITAHCINSAKIQKKQPILPAANLSSGGQDQNLFGVLSGKMAYAFVECGEDQIACNRHAKQVRICNLLVTVQTPEKGLGQRAPVGCAGVVVVARMNLHLLQQLRGLHSCHKYVNMPHYKKGDKK